MAAVDSSSHDWSKSLQELDKGFKSAVVGEQAEAVARVPQILDRHQFPIFVNAALIKLGDLFQNTVSNVIRQCIVEVICRCHDSVADKMISLAEISKKFYVVSFSNDPIARALALKALGWLAAAFARNHSIQDLVKRSLDTHHVDELNAAIFAAKRYAACSQEFFLAVFDKVCELLSSMAYSTAMKRELLPILRCARLEQLARLEAMDLTNLVDQPEVVMDIMTDLAIRSVINAPGRINQLLKVVLAQDSKPRVAKAALGGLVKLAESAPHMWLPRHFDALFESISNFCDLPSGDVSRQAVSRCTGLLAVILALLAQPACSLALDPSMLVVIRSLTGQQRSISLQCAAVKVLTYQTSPRPDEILLHVAVIMNNAKVPVSCLSDLLRRVCDMAKASEAAAKELCALLARQLPSSADEKCRLVTSCLLNCADYYPSVVKSLDCSSHLAASKAPSMEMLSLALASGQRDVSAASLDDWQKYRLGRAAVRFGRHDVAAGLFAQVLGRVFNESYWSWLKGLVSLCRGEAGLTSDPYSVVPAIDQERAALHFFDARADHPFPAQFVRGRIAFLEALNQLNLTAQFAPKLTVEDGTVALFSAASDIFLKLHDSGFDSDQRSLQYLRLWECVCLVIRDKLKSLAVDVKHQVDVSRLSSMRIVGWQNLTLKRTIQELAKSLDCCKTLKATAKAVHEKMLQPICLPRFFFQRLQSTDVKLSVSPSPTDNSTAFKIPSDQRLLLKVEGLIESHNVSKGQRTVSAVVVRVYTKYGTTGAQSVPDSSLPMVLDRTVSVKNWYFVAEGLLDLRESATLLVRAHLLDSDGGMWDCNARESLKVQVLQQNVRPYYSVPTKQRKVAV